MMSELTNQIEKFQENLALLDGKERSKAYEANVKLAQLVLDLSRRVDNLVDAEETTG